MAKYVQKPTMKMKWSGVKGNKFRTWEIINHEGNRYVRTNKDTALRQFQASMRMYNKYKNK